jgi:Reverse transcriptase (RNA-dependent DNA polymerase)
MTQPPGFVNPDFTYHVCCLKKALYGLKQVSRAWFHRLKEFLATLRYTSSQSDSSLFLKTKHGDTIYLLVYVDDIIVTGTSPFLIQSLLAKLHDAFIIKDLDPRSYFLSIEATQTATTLHLSQSRYIVDLLLRAHMTDDKSVATPMQSGLQLLKLDGDPMQDPFLYHSIVGVLQYATITRLKISFVVHKVSLFMHSPTDKH